MSSEWGRVFKGYYFALVYCRRNDYQIGVDNPFGKQGMERTFDK